MDHHRQRHHNTYNHQFMDSNTTRYFPPRPPPHHHHHPNLYPPPPPYPHLPPPQLPPPRPPPPQFRLLPPPIPHLQPPFNFAHDDRDPYIPNFEYPPNQGVGFGVGVPYDRQYRDDDRRRLYLPEPPRVAPFVPPPISSSGLVRDHEISPSFREIQFDGFMHHLDEDTGIQLRSDDWREKRSVMDDLERDRLEDHLRFHEQYHPEMFPGEFELSSGIAGCVRETMVDEVTMRDGGDGIIMDDGLGVNVMYDIQPPSSFKFRNRGIDRDDGSRELYDEGMNQDLDSSPRYYSKGNRREEMQDYSRTLKKNLKKKSAFLRIHPSKHSSFRNRRDTTLSPHKVKGSLEVIGHRLGDEKGESPVELDVSFKSNSLVAKAIMAVPSCSKVDPNENTALNALDTRVESKSPLKAEGNRNCRDNSSISGKVDKHSEKKFRISPTLKRVGLQSNVDVCCSNLELSSLGSSSLTGSSIDRGSSKGEVLDKDTRDAGLCKISSPSLRKKRKSDSLLSRLSDSPTKTYVELANTGSSADHPSGSSMSDDCIKRTGKESPSIGQVVGSALNETLLDTENTIVKESPLVVVQAVGDTVTDSPLLKRTRKKGLPGSCIDSSGPLHSRMPEALVETNRCMEDMPTISKVEEDVTKSLEKCISGTSTVVRGYQSQIILPVLVGNGSGEGSAEPLISRASNIDNIGIFSDYSDKCDTSDVINPISNNLDAPIKIQDQVEVTCIADKPCGTQIISSPETDIIRQSYGEEHLDGDGNIQDEAENNRFLVNSSKVDISGENASASFSHDYIAIDSKKFTTVPSLKVENDYQEQQCRVEGTVWLSSADRGGPSKASSYVERDLTLFPMEQYTSASVLSRKRKSEDEEQYTDRTKNFQIMNSNLPVPKVGSAVLGLPCCGAEPDILLWKELKGSSADQKASMDHGDNLDAIEFSTHYSKKNKSVSTHQSASKNSDLPAPLDSLICTPGVPTQSAEEIERSKMLLLEQSVMGGTVSSSQKTRHSFADCLHTDLALRELFLTVNRNAPLDAIQSSYLSCKQEKKVNLLMGGTFDCSKSIALDSELGISTNYPSRVISCMEQNDDSGDSGLRPLLTGTECEDIIAVDDNLPSGFDTQSLVQCPDERATVNDHMGESSHEPLITVVKSKEPSASDCLWSHSGCADGGATIDFDMGGVQSNTVDAHSLRLNTFPAPNLLSDGKLGMNAKKSSECSVTLGHRSSQSNSFVKNDETNSKPGVSATAAAYQPFAQRKVVSVKNAKITASLVNPMNRHIIKRNVLVRDSSVITPSNKAVPAYPGKPRTWCRTDKLPTSNTIVKKPSVGTVPPASKTILKKTSIRPVPLQRPPIDKNLKKQSNCYIRKGNSLVRNPATGAATMGTRVLGSGLNESKGNYVNIVRKTTGSTEMIDSSVICDALIAGQGTHVEMPKTPPLPCSGMTSDCEIGCSGDCISSLPVGRSAGIDNEATKSSETTTNSSENLEADVNRSLEDPGTLSDGNFPALDLKKIVYIKHKSNQLIASSNHSKPSVHNTNMSPALSSESGYYKRRKNQLIRASSESNIQQLVSRIDNISNTQPQKAFNVYTGRNSTKRQSNKVKAAKVSLVWKLGDAKSSSKGVDPLRRGKILSHLLPWKRATYWRSVWRSSANFSSNPSLMITRRLLSPRKRAAVYVRSGRGFSLRRSKVISLAGSSLKWSISMERRSKKVDEEAARGVAAMDSREKPKTSATGERIYRIGMFRYRMDPSRRTLQRVADEVSSNPSTSKPKLDARKTYVPKRLLIGSNEYVRIGNGNQLVRDPKRRTRLLASEKVRWSLHTARMRLAKKRKFCQFFTRFGKCNKGEGKCPYIHDPSKIAVCTKFLNGLCSDPSCKLTHQVIPERMPDCSFFLQGSCSNESCPYRHVNVNPKAPICESFLRGYCAEGNECQKKHSYICPEFEGMGSCPRGSRCKLYHPKKGKGKKGNCSKEKRHPRGRYFGSVLATTSEAETDMAKKHIAPTKSIEGSEGELGDFIDLDASDDEPWEKHDPEVEPMSLSEGEAAVNTQLDDIDELIMPLRIMDRHTSD